MHTHKGIITKKRVIIAILALLVLGLVIQLMPKRAEQPAKTIFALQRLGKADEYKLLIGATATLRTEVTAVNLFDLTATQLLDGEDTDAVVTIDDTKISAPYTVLEGVHEVGFEVTNTDPDDPTGATTKQVTIIIKGVHDNFDLNTDLDLSPIIIDQKVVGDYAIQDKSFVLGVDILASFASQEIVQIEYTYKEGTTSHRIVSNDMTVVLANSTPDWTSEHRYIGFAKAVNDGWDIYEKEQKQPDFLSFFNSSADFVQVTITLSNGDIIVAKK